jgi:hypothetical protein
MIPNRDNSCRASTTACLRDPDRNSFKLTP